MHEPTSVDPAALLAGAAVVCVVLGWIAVSFLRRRLGKPEMRSPGAAARQAVSSAAAGVRAAAQRGTSIIHRPRLNLHPLTSAGTSIGRALDSAESGISAATTAAVAGMRWRWQRFSRARTRREVITRVWDGTSDYLGGLLESEPAVRRPFVLGLAAAWTYHWNQAIEHFQEAKARASEAQAVPLLNHIGMCHRIQGCPDEALKVYSESARLAARTRNQQGRAAALNNIAVIRHDYGELDAALKQLREGLAAAHASGDERSARICLANIGNILRDKGRLGDALKSHHEALAISERIGDGPGVADCLGNIAGVLRELNDLDQAKEYYTKALDYAIEIRYDIGVAVDLSGLAGVHFDKGELDLALDLHEKAVATSRRIGYRLGTAAGLGNIGLILVKQDEHEQAAPHLAEALTLFQTMGVTAGTLPILTGLARCDESLGRNRVRQLLKQVLPTDELCDGVLECVDRQHRRRPRQKSPQFVGQAATRH